MLRKTILVADDSEGIRNVVQLMLEPAYDVFVTGENVQSCIQERRPDLVLMDVGMQGQDGLEITRQMKSLAETRSIPILLFSAAADLNTLAKQAGADGFIEKPFGIRTLQQAVHHLIGG